MAAPRQKRDKIIQRSDSHNSDEDMACQDTFMDNQSIQIEFVGRQAEDCDFHGIRKLLAQLFLKANVNVSELSTTLISQNYVGSVLMQADLPEDDSDSDEDDIFGVTSVVNLTERRELECVQQLKKYLVNSCKKSGAAKTAELERVLYSDEHQVGLLLNERFINIPPQVALPTLDSLRGEMTRATKKGMKYAFTHYVMVCKTYRLPGPSTHGPRKKNGAGDGMDTLIFTNEEESYFQKHASVCCEYSVAGEQDTAVDMSMEDDAEEEEQLLPGRLVLVLEQDKLTNVLDELRTDMHT